MSSKDEETRDSTAPPAGAYDVGYGKPPSAFRFKKGVSGNPKGRPPGRGKTIRSALKDALSKVTSSEKNSRQAEALAVSSADLREKWPANVTDEELLRLVKARKLTWKALFSLYLEEKEEKASEPVSPSKPSAS